MQGPRTLNSSWSSGRTRILSFSLSAASSALPSDKSRPSASPMAAGCATQASRRRSVEVLRIQVQDYGVQTSHIGPRTKTSWDA